MKFAKCRDCQQWIIWADDGTGRKKPFDAEGTHWVLMEADPDDQGRPQAAALRIVRCHWETCPKKQQQGEGGTDDGPQEDEQ